MEAFFRREWMRRGWRMWVLWPISLLFGSLVALRRWMYAQGTLKARRLPLPVVVVGNRIVGGAGKTPTVIAVVAHLRQRGYRPGVISRGYGAHADGTRDAVLVDDHCTAADCGDEPLLIHRRSHVPVAVGPDRLQAGLHLVATHPDVDIVVCDDGLQHLQLARDLEIVVFDDRGAGNGWLLPAGPLREPLAPARATLSPPLLHLYTTGQRSTPLPGFLAQRQLNQLTLLDDWWSGQTAGMALPELASQPGIWAVAGIAHPTRFFDALRAAGLQIEPCALPDHHHYTTLPWPSTAQDVVLTEKDAIKLPPDRIRRERPQTRVWVAALDFDLEPAFWTALDCALTHLPTSHGQPLA